MMKAFAFERYGAPERALALKEFPIPEPKADQVVVRVKAVGLNPLDWHLVRGEPYIIRAVVGAAGPPAGSIAGGAFAGIVERVGENVTDFAPGDAVFGDPGMDLGGLAEFAVGSHRALAHKPAQLSFEEAASFPISATSAFQAIHNVLKLQKGQHVLIHGASGGVGTAAVQIAKAAGAEVTAVCGTRNLDLMKKLGADHVIDYTKENFTTAGIMYDAVLDNVSTIPISDVCKVIVPGGSYVGVGQKNGGKLFGGMVGALVGGLFRDKSRNVESFMASAGGKCLQEITPPIEAGTLVAVIDKTFPFEKTPEAFAYLEEGHVSGKVVITLP
ncbi:alcohol dehydrogenase [Obelidium mucronatum]|nr:alcohol dehydrogenase [Obelidium mucronatum]